MKKKKVIALIVVLVAAAAAGGTGFYFRSEIGEFALDKFETVSAWAADRIPFLNSGKSDDKVYVEKVSKIMNTYTGVSNRYNGVVESQESYEVNLDTSREVKEILVEVGDTVEEGQELVIYDTSDLEMQVKQANLEVESINNDIENSRKRIASLNDQLSKTEDEDEKFDLTTEIQSEENSIEQTEFDLESKKLEIEKYEEQISESTVVSKQSGVVKEINESGMDSNGNTAAFMTILREGEYRVKGSVDEQNVWMISEGTPVIIRSRVDNSQIWNGQLAKLDTDNIQSDETDNYYGSESGDGATKYPFYVELDSSEGLLLGQHVYIEMDEGQEEAKEGLWLYSNYIVQDDTGAYVWAANDRNRLEKRYVELGELDEELGEYEILSGITGSDYITWPMEGLYEGVTTVTDAEEVDYSSPLYNQESTELEEDWEDWEDFEGYEDMESFYGTESIYDTEMYDDYDYEDYGDDYNYDDTEMPEEDLSLNRAGKAAESDLLNGIGVGQ